MSDSTDVYGSYVRHADNVLAFWIGNAGLLVLGVAAFHYLSWWGLIGCAGVALLWFAVGIRNSATFSETFVAIRRIEWELEAIQDSLRRIEGREKAETTLWRLVKGNDKALGIRHTLVPGVKFELWVTVCGVLRHRAVYEDSTELAAAANQKREELIGRGWADAPSADGILWLEHR